MAPATLKGSFNPNAYYLLVGRGPDPRETRPSGVGPLDDWIKILDRESVIAREMRAGSNTDTSDPAELVLDGWGNRVILRLPGPIHRHGWDVYSTGSNGIDEHGRGDDIVIGEELAEVTSAR